MTLELIKCPGCGMTLFKVENLLQQEKQTPLPAKQEKKKINDDDGVIDLYEN